VELLLLPGFAGFSLGVRVSGCFGAWMCRGPGLLASRGIVCLSAPSQEGGPSGTARRGLLDAAGSGKIRFWDARLYQQRELLGLGASQDTRGYWEGQTFDS